MVSSGSTTLPPLPVPRARRQSVTNTAVFQKAPGTDEVNHAYGRSSIQPQDEPTDSSGCSELERASVKWPEKLQSAFERKPFSDKIESDDTDWTDEDVITDRSGSESDDCPSFQALHAKTASMLSTKVKNNTTYPRENSRKGTPLLKDKEIRKRMFKKELYPKLLKAMVNERKFKKELKEKRMKESCHGTRKWEEIQDEYCVW